MNYIPLKYIREMKSFVGLRDFFSTLKSTGRVGSKIYRVVKNIKRPVWGPKKLGLEGWALVTWLSLIGAQNLPKHYLEV
jgi:hypothetical protein